MRRNKYRLGSVVRRNQMRGIYRRIKFAMLEKVNRELVMDGSFIPNFKKLFTTP